MLGLFLRLHVRLRGHILRFSAKSFQISDWGNPHHTGCFKLARGLTTEMLTNSLFDDFDKDETSKFLFWIVFLLVCCLPRLLMLFLDLLVRCNKIVMIWVWVSSRFVPMVVSHPVVSYSLYSIHKFIWYTSCKLTTVNSLSRFVLKFDKKFESVRIFDSKQSYSYSQLSW